MCLFGFRVSGFGVRGSRSGFGVWNLGLGIWGVEFRVSGLTRNPEFRVSVQGFRTREEVRRDVPDVPGQVLAVLGGADGEDGDAEAMKCRAARLRALQSYVRLRALQNHIANFETGAAADEEGSLLRWIGARGEICGGKTGDCSEPD